MAYDDLLDVEGINSQYLVIVKPRRLVDTSMWVLVSGTKYTQNFIFGQAVECSVDDSLLTEASSSSLLDGGWYYEESTGNIYLDNGADPSSSDVIITYEIFLGTFDAHFNRDPMDTASRVVYYEPLIVKSPEILASNSDIIFGFLPTVSTTIIISNLSQYLQEHLYGSSFNRCEIKVYHWLDELTEDNIKLVSQGICGSISSSDESIQITIYDNNDFFNAEFRHANNVSSFFAISSFPNLDPNYQSRAIRKIYGVSDSFIPVNIDYNVSAPTNLNNRTWVCLKPHTDLGSVSTTVPVSPASTTTRTYLASANGIRLGDSVWIDSSAGSGFDEFVIVTSVNKTGSHYIEHAAIATAAASASVVKRNFVGKVTIFKEGVEYSALYGKHYDEYTDAVNSVAGFTFKATLEVDLGISLTPQDLVYARVYGNKNTTTMSASPFGSDSAYTNNLTQAVVIFYDLLKTYLGIDESRINLASFTSLQAAASDEIGYVIPSLAQSNFPTFKDIFSDLTQTLLAKFYIDDNNDFALTQTAPKGAASKTISDDEILVDSFSYEFDYRDIRSDIFVQYSPREISLRNDSNGPYYSLVSSSSNTAKRLHKIQKQETFTSFHFIESQAQTLADRLSYALGDRRGFITFTTKNRFFDSQINEVVEISRAKLAGYSFDIDTLRERDSVIISTQKSLDQITITLDDQKGIEDNIDNWG